MRRGLDTPVGVTTRTSRAPSGASAVTVTLAGRRLSSFFGAGSIRVMPPRSDSIVTTDLGGGGAVTLVAVKPEAPLKMKPVTLARFSPEKTIFPVVPRWIHSGEREVS